MTGVQTCALPISGGSAEFYGKDLLAMPPEIRSHEGLFLGFQYPVEIPGVSMVNFMRAAVNAKREYAGRASGWKNDTRKRHPYDMYDKVEWKEITLTGCDSMDRYYVHIQELYQSLDIIEQLIDNIPEGEYYIKQKPIIKVPEGQWYFSVEGASGEFGVYLDSKGDKSPYRMKMRPMGLSLTGALDPMLRGQKIADLITTGAAIDFVIPDIDR